MNKQIDRKAPEVLAPAGDSERLQAALQFGADAVYFAGTSYGMRTAPSNFNCEEMRQAIEQVHAAGSQAYITCNTFPHNEEMAALPDYLEFLNDSGADAVIVADLGVLSLAKKYAPRCAVHISTQAGVVNYETARVLYEMGASRVVLAREMTLHEIAELRDKTPRELEIECFVHGAMCMSVSGRCMLSNYLTGRDANRGDCAQPCRWKYHLTEEKRPGQYFPIGEDEEGTFLLNANDLCMIDYIAELDKAGVTSLKIEGRAKAAYYVAVTTNAYRAAVDAYIQSGFSADFKPAPWMVEELNKISHRPYSTGFFFQKPTQNTAFGGYIREYTIAAVVEGWENGRLYCTQRNHFHEGERLDALEPRQAPSIFEAKELQDANGQPIEKAPHAMMPVSMASERPLSPGTLLRKELK